MDFDTEAPAHSPATQGFKANVFTGLITDLEFAFGEFKTHQAAIARVEMLTGLHFGSLKDNDPPAGAEGIGINEIAQPADIQI